MLEREYKQLPKANRRIYDLVIKFADGNVSRFASDIGSTPQGISRLFRVDPRRGKFPNVSQEIQASCIRTYELPHNYFTNDDKPLVETSPYYDNATIEGCTTYFARHTWATIAASLDIPKEIIAHALGHGAHSVTDIYIDFDRTKVDEANREVIDYVLQKKGGTSATL